MKSICYEEICPQCEGTGITQTHKCSMCKGTGLVERIDVDESLILENSKE